MTKSLNENRKEVAWVVFTLLITIDSFKVISRMHIKLGPKPKAPLPRTAMVNPSFSKCLLIKASIT